MSLGSISGLFALVIRALNFNYLLKISVFIMVNNPDKVFTVEETGSFGNKAEVNTGKIGTFPRQKYREHRPHRAIHGLKGSQVNSELAPITPPKEQHTCLLCQAPACSLPLPKCKARLHKPWRPFWISALESTKIQKACTSSLIGIVGPCLVVEMVSVPFSDTPPSTTVAHSCCRLERMNICSISEPGQKCALTSMSSLPKITPCKILLPHKIQLDNKTRPHTYLDTETAQHTPSEAEELTLK